MLIKIRKESFGYVLFNRHNREHHFVETDEKLEQLSKDALIAYLGRYFQNTPVDLCWEFINPKGVGLSLSAPIGMYLEISSHCNLRCNHCYKPQLNLKPTLSLSQFLHVIDELHGAGVFEIRISGNEPTASPYLFDIAEHVKKNEMYLGINTNAFFGKEIQEQLVDLQPDLVAISIDGNQVTHDSIRQEGSYDRAISLLARLSNEPIKKRINTVISKVTAGAMENIAILAERFRAEVSFLPFRPVGKNRNFSNENAINCQDMLHIVQEVMHLRRKYPDVVLLTYFDILGKKALYHHTMPFNSPCPARKNGFISYSGDFFPCDFLRYLGKTYFCGNVVRDGFWKLWSESSVLHNFQNIEHGKCRRCRFYMTHCNGGCISGSLASSNDPDDELCFVDIL